MSSRETEELPETPTIKVSLSQYAFSGSPTAPPTTRLTRSSNSAAAPLPSTPNTASKSVSRPPTATSPLAPVSTQKNNKKRKRESSSYAASSRKYAHLPNLLVDVLAPNLICVFIGVNPGLKTASSGHAYAHPSNLFWKLLHSSGCTPRLCKPVEDRNLPRLYALGNTNIVSRATKDASELSKAEMDDGVAVLEEKIARWRPEAVCVVGKGIWESVWRVRHGRPVKKEEFRYGWQDDAERMGVVKANDAQESWEGARVFVATTTSGLAAGMRPYEKEKIWRVLGEWVARRRMERGIPDEGGVREQPNLAKEDDGLI